MPLRFRDREEAGQVLADQLQHYSHRTDVLVLALPRGGVPVAFQVAQRLGAPLDVFLVRKLGAPGQEELALGAIATGDVLVLNHEVVDLLRIPSHAIDEIAARELLELSRREREYRDGRPAPDVRGRTVILVDDGLATGATMRAAAAALRKQRPARIVVAVPTAAAQACEEFRTVVDEVVCATTPEPFLAVGYWYQNFVQTSDEEVRDLLQRARRQGDRDTGGSYVEPVDHWTPLDRPVRVPVGSLALDGDLSVPVGARGIVLFSHGSGSSRHSPRNRFVAHALQQGGLGTLLIDLLTPEEEAVDQRTAHLRFDVALLADRLAAAIDWLSRQPETRGLRVGLFGASTGGGAALVAAAERPDPVGAVVSRGGRPDLAGAALLCVRAPTLLVIGGQDVPVIRLNREAFAQLRGEKQLEIVPGATHLFEEPGALETVARLARDWFERHLASAANRVERITTVDR